jgi:NAD(P)-dependent dehydrogenase (short-subunit alcohol dehydrogenase family)
MSCGLLDLARRAGLQPARVAGHSFGEFVALHAAGVLTREDLLRLAGERGRLMAAVGPGAGTMVAVPLDRQQISGFIDAADDLWIANQNGPRQLVLSGTDAAIARVVARLGEHGHTARPLPVGAGFHSPLVSAAAAPFGRFLDESIRFTPPAVPIHSGFDGQLYPEAPADISSVCAAHMMRGIDFTAVIEAMWRAGARCFLEIGPGRVLTGLVGQILGDRPHLAVAADGGVRGWLGAMARLWTQGVPLDLKAGFASRPVRLLDLERLPEPAVSSGWLMDGGRLRRAGEAGLIGTAPLLDADSEPAPFAANSVDGTTAIYAEYQETMRHFLKQQEDVLSRMLDLPRPRPEPDPAPAPVTALMPPPQIVAASEPAALDYDTLIVTVLHLVSERTGYPLDILQPQQDLEAELGVDSIKRIEIVGRLIKVQTDAVAEQLQQSFEALVRAKSADALVRSVLMAVRAVDHQAAPVTTTACPRALLRPVARKLPRGARGLHGLYLVAAGDEALAEDVVAGLCAHGAVAYVLRIAVAEGLADRLEALRGQHGPVRGIVHLSPLDQLAGEHRFEAWRAATRANTKNLFVLLQACASELADETKRLHVVSVSRLRAPASGGPGGLLRSAAQEFQNLLVKVVDFDDAHTRVQMAADIVREVLNPGGGDDIGYRSGERYFFHPEAAELDAMPDRRDWRPCENWVVLATGGGRGITAEIVGELATPGVRLVLVGRSESDASGERAANIERFRRSGAQVEYHALDVRSEVEFGGLIDDLYRRYGRIDAVLHGAGVIEDQRLAQKDLASFERVFDSKADSTFILSQHLRPDGLKWVVLFGSVSGVFGNSGQADYAAGNEALARLGHRMNLRWPVTRVVTLQWGPWSRIGMASEGVQRLLAGKGITPIEPEAGRQFFVAELSRGRKADAEVIAGHGPWHQEPDRHLTSIFESLMALSSAGDTDGLRQLQAASP